MWECIKIVFTPNCIKAIYNKLKKEIKRMSSTKKSNQIILFGLKVFSASMFIGLLIFSIYYFKYMNEFNDIEKDYIKNFVPIVVPFMVLLSALLASFSVTANIENTNKLEENRIKRIKKRNLSILKMDLMFLIKEVNEQLNVIEYPLKDLYNFRYDENQIRERVYRLADKITGLEINEFNSLDILYKLSAIQKTVYDKVHIFSDIFKEIEKLLTFDLSYEIRMLIDQTSKLDVKDVGYENFDLSNKFDEMWSNNINTFTLTPTNYINEQDCFKIYAQFCEIHYKIKNLKALLEKDKIALNTLHDELVI